MLKASYGDPTVLKFFEVVKVSFVATPKSAAKGKLHKYYFET
jgi:hypothetical protein